MLLRRNGVKLQATLTNLEGKPALLLAGQAIVPLSDPVLRQYKLAKASKAELSELKGGGWGGDVPTPPPDDDDPLF